jgi:hypothetical protein
LFSESFQDDTHNAWQKFGSHSAVKGILEISGKRIMEYERRKNVDPGADTEKEIKSGDYVNLSIGIPNLVANSVITTSLMSFFK